MSAPLQPSQPSYERAEATGKKPPDVLTWIVVGSCVAMLFWFYGAVTRYGATRSETTFGWLLGAWNPENDYEHGVLFLFLIPGLIAYKWRDLRAASGTGNMWGLAVVFIGVVFYAAAYRTLQPRIAAGALPFLLWGSALYLWGWRVARILLFPLFFFWLAVPLPSFQQATSKLQALAAILSQQGSALFGVQTRVNGNEILSVSGNWAPLEIAGGCSGIRSLMALLMISGAWAFIAKIPMWKRLVLFFSAIPLAILGNALRVTSIFVIAEYGNAEWARTTWHDWSGLLLFYPISLMLLLGIHTLLEGGLPWNRQRKVAIRRVVNPTIQAN